jgi:hypothetical protein
MSEEGKGGTQEQQEQQEQKEGVAEGIPALGRKTAGIDIGSKQHWVCATAPEGSRREVEVFGATTPELQRMGAWLKERRVESVALESTGVYWIPVQEVLEEHGGHQRGKPIQKKKRRGGASTRVSAALRMAATTLRHSQTALGAHYRRIARHKGADVAVFATARKLATLICRLLRWGKKYVDEGAQAYERRYQEARIRRLTATVKEPGYQLTPLATAA